MKNPNRTKSEKLLTELFQETRLLSPVAQPEVSMDDLKLLGVGFNHRFKTSANKVNEVAERRLAFKQIYKKLTDAIELAEDFKFEKLAKKLNEVKSKLDKKVKK